MTFQGIAGTTRLGTFVTRSEGLGDVSVPGLIPLLRGAHHHLQLNVGMGVLTVRLNALPFYEFLT